MAESVHIAPVRVLPDDVANKIAAGEVVERPASVVKELLENALDAGATHIVVNLEASGRRTIEVLDNGHGMSEQNALLSIERHATSKIRKAADLEAVHTLGFRGEALASIASVSRFVLTTRRAKDESATRIRIDGGVLRDVEQAGAPPGTRVAVNHLYFNTPVRSKFLKGVATELGHCIDVVQRHALARLGVGFQLLHNGRMLLDVPAQASLRERVALIWGLSFLRDMADLQGDAGGFHLRGVIGLPGLTRSARSHQFFFINGRPVMSPTLQYGFEDGYRGLLTVGRRPVGVLMLEVHPRFVDVNIHPAKREVRFRDDRAVRDILSAVVRECLSALAPKPAWSTPDTGPEAASFSLEPLERPESAPMPPPAGLPTPEPPRATPVTPAAVPAPATPPAAPTAPAAAPAAAPAQTELPGFTHSANSAMEAAYQPVGRLADAPIQLFDTYLLCPAEDRLLIIDQHALHERLNYDNLLNELRDTQYESQQLAVPLVIEVAPAQVRLMESNLEFFQSLGIHIEPFGGNTFQVSAICHLYDDDKVRDAIYSVLDSLGQGDLFDRGNLMEDMLRMASRACKASVRAGDRLTAQERQILLEGFRRLRPPYTCPHGRPIIVEITQRQMEKSFRRIQ